MKFNQIGFFEVADVTNKVVLNIIGAQKLGRKKSNISFTLNIINYGTIGLLMLNKKQKKIYILN